MASVGSYVIPWESHGNFCHLRFSCLDAYTDYKKGCHSFWPPKVIFQSLEVRTPDLIYFYFSTTCLTRRVTHQNGHFLPARGYFKVSYCKVLKYTYQFMGQNL